MATSTATRSQPQPPHLNSFTAEIPFRGVASTSSPVLCSAHLHHRHPHPHPHPKYKSVPLQNIESHITKAESPLPPIPKSASSSAPQSRSSTPYRSAPGTPLSTASDSSYQRREKKPGSLFKSFHFSVSSYRQRSSSYDFRRDSLGPQSRRNPSTSSISFENGDIPSPPPSPKTTATGMPHPVWTDDSKRRRRSRAHSAASHTSAKKIDEMGFPFGKSLPSNGAGRRGRDLGSATHIVPRCPAQPSDPFSVHPGTPVDFSTPEVPSFPYKRHSSSSKDRADEYHAYLSSEVRERGKSLPEWERLQ